MRHFNPQLFDPWATHLPTLLQAVSLTSGPVLEIGCGMYSTFCLHAACVGRTLVSLETCPRWFERFKALESPDHDLRLGRTYDDFDAEYQRRWDVVLIDHAPAGRRVMDLPKVLHARLVVIHDTESDEYGWESVMKLFKFQKTNKLLTPWTTIASNIDALEAFPTH